MSRLAIVSGALANKPMNGGEAWVRLSWARGLRQLGFKVCFIEQITGEACVNESGHPAAIEQSINLQYFRDVTRAFGLSDGCALILDDGRPIEGLSREDLHEIAKSADVLLNISGHLRDPRLLPRIRRRCFIDIDPGYTQIWHEQKLAAVGGHDFYFTIGQDIGSTSCPIPTCGIEWKPTRQPVVLEDWPVAPPPDRSDRFTTVAAWRGSFGSVEYGGRTFGQKAHEFRKFIELPQRSPHEFEIALSIHPGDARDLAVLKERGWRIVDPRAVAADPQSFRRYVQQSWAEFSVAQGIYVDTQCGWFSDRSVRYLASGRPALVQETGFSAHFGRGEGLVAFTTLNDAIAGAEAIAGEYPHHQRAARALAEEVFDSRVVLSDLLRQAGVSL